MPTIVTTEPERRQIARVMEFPPDLALYIDWEKIATQARELGANFDARFTDRGACTVTLFWAYAESDFVNYDDR